MKKELYAKDAKGQIRVWTIEALEDGLYMEHGVLGGNMQEKFEGVFEGLASRTLEEQIESRFNSRVSKKIDSGYSESVEAAQTKERTNSLGFARPMLAAKFDTVKNIDYSNLYYQYKYDGNRLLVKNENGTLIAYSRQGKVVDTLPELLSEIDIPEGVTIDGEIYCHGESLQTIVSWVKRRQENTLKLRYHVYDVIVDKPYSDRLYMLKSFELGSMAQLVPTHKYDFIRPVHEIMHSAIRNGYEGLILRQNNFGYEQKRSKSLIKVKHFEDDEFLITGMHLSRDGVPMIDFITDEGVVAKTVAPGSFENKNLIYQNRDEIAGKYVHLEYSMYTKDRVPFHPNAIQILDTRNQLK